MASPVRHAPDQTIDPAKVARLLARSSELCGQTRRLLQHSRNLVARRNGRPRLRVVGAAAGAPVAPTYSARALFAAADDIEGAIRGWRDAPPPVREAVEDSLYEAAELIRKTARFVSQHDG